MAIEETSFIDSAAWRPEYATIEVRRSDVVLKDGEEVSRTYHRHVVPPEQEDLSGEDPIVQEMAATYAAERQAMAIKNLLKVQKGTA
jgi:hypothetical protein